METAAEVSPHQELLRAIRQNDPDTVRRLIKDGCPLTAPGRLMASANPLFQALQREATYDIAKILLEQGADPDQLLKDDIRRFDGDICPLFAALRSDAPEKMCRLLLQFGVDFDNFYALAFNRLSLSVNGEAEKMIKEGLSKDKPLMLHLISRLDGCFKPVADFSAHVGVYRFLLSNGITTIEEKDARGRAVLDFCLKMARVAADKINMKHSPVSHEHWLLEVKALNEASNGALFSAIVAETGQNAWHRFFSGLVFEDVCGLKLWLRPAVEADSNAAVNFAVRDMLGAFPLDYLLGRNYEMREKKHLLALGLPHSYDTPAMRSMLEFRGMLGAGDIYTPPTDVLRALTDEVATTVDIFGQTALHYACYVGCLPIVQQLVDNGRSSLTARTRTSLNFLAGDVFDMTLQGKIQWQVVEGERVTGVGVALARVMLPDSNYSSNDREWEQDVQVLRLLLASSGAGDGPQVNQIYDTAAPVRRSLLHYAVEWPANIKYDAQRLFISCSKPAFHIYSRQFKVVEALLSSGANVNVTNCFGHTPLLTFLATIKCGIDNRDVDRDELPHVLMSDSCIPQAGGLLSLFRRFGADFHVSAPMRHLPCGNDESSPRFTSPAKLLTAITNRWIKLPMHPNMADDVAIQCVNSEWRTLGRKMAFDQHRMLLKLAARFNRDGTVKPDAGPITPVLSVKAVISRQLTPTLAQSTLCLSPSGVSISIAHAAAPEAATLSARTGCADAPAATCPAGCSSADVELAARLLDTTDMSFSHYYYFYDSLPRALSVISLTLHLVRYHSQQLNTIDDMCRAHGVKMGQTYGSYSLIHLHRSLDMLCEEGDLQTIHSVVSSDELLSYVRQRPNSSTMGHALHLGIDDVTLIYGIVRSGEVALPQAVAGEALASDTLTALLRLTQAAPTCLKPELQAPWIFARDLLAGSKTEDEFRIAFSLGLEAVGGHRTLLVRQLPLVHAIDMDNAFSLRQMLRHGANPKRPQLYAYLTEDKDRQTPMRKLIEGHYKPAAAVSALVHAGVDPDRHVRSKRLGDAKPVWAPPLVAAVSALCQRWKWQQEAQMRANSRAGTHVFTSDPMHVLHSELTLALALIRSGASLYVMGPPAATGASGKKASVVDGITTTVPLVSCAPPHLQCTLAQEAAWARRKHAIALREVLGL